ncbi:DUF1330 domain-containing protein [Nocardia asteroides]|nr:DUF1330 domain-containing protein [Nocardia asteroides]
MAQKSILSYGGRYLVAGPTPEPVEGTWDSPRFLVIEFCQRSSKIRPSALFENRPPIHDRKGDLSAGMGADQVSPC